MMVMLGIFLFGAALAVSVYAIGVTVAPNLDRIGDALAGRNRHFAPLETLVLAERRIAVRRWSAQKAAPARRRAAA